jgi:dTDP-4-amino-4,6-dideoxygalactose transaminase
MDERRTMIPLYKVGMSPAIDKPLLETLHSGFIGEGPRVKEFERAVEAIVGNPVLAVNSCTAALTLAFRLSGVRPGLEVVSTPMTCLGALSPILLPDGKTMPIGKIVNQRKALKVISLNIQSGKLEEKQIINWIKLSGKDVTWYRLHHVNSRSSRGIGGKAGIWITGDHKIHCRTGLVRVDKLNPLDEVATTGKELNIIQKEFLDGTMLGDGYIRHEGKGWARFAVIHSEKQKEWVSLKKRALNGIDFNNIERDAINQSGPACGIETKKGIFWLNEYRRWYSARGKKIVPDDLKFTPLVLAAWYMDDGSLDKTGSAIFCTEGFDTEDVWKLFWKLCDVGFHPRVYGRKKSYGLRILANESNKFFNLIGRYVPETMRYKVTSDAPAFDICSWNLGETEPFYDVVIVEKMNPPQWNNPRFVYCIEVEDNHNFISGDMVLSNCTATNMAILATGGEIIWADIDPHTGLIDPEDAERAVSIYTRAICCVDWGGTPCELGELKSITKGYGLKLVEDAACSLGASFEGRPIGSISDFTCFSFQAIKHLTTVDGGALSVLDAGTRERGRLMRWFGIDRDCPGRDIRCEGDIHEWGYKFHMSDVTASIGLAQIAARVHESSIGAARANAAWYDAEFQARGIRHVEPVRRRPGRDSNFWLYTILCDHRDELVEHLRTWRIAASQTHRRNDLFRCFRPYLDRRLPGVDEFSRRQCSIPVGWWVSEADRKHIMNAVENFDRNWK